MKIIKPILIALIVLPLLAAGIFFLNFDRTAFRMQMQEQAGAALGRPVEVKGKINFDLKGGWMLSVDDVVIGNPEGFTSKHLVKLDTISVALNWLALLEHKVDVRRILVQGATINLETSASGKNNWDMNRAAPLPTAKADKTATDKPAEKPAEKGVFYVDQIDLTAIEILDAKITQIDGRNDKTQLLEIDEGKISAPHDGVLRIDAKGDLNHTPYAVKLAVQQGWQALLAGKETPVDVKITFAGTDYALKGHFSKEDKAYKLAALEVQAKGISATGNLKINPEGKVPFVSGKLNIPEVNMQTLQKAARGDEKIRAIPIAAPSSAVAPQQPDLSALKVINTDIDLRVGALVFAPDKKFDNIRSNLSLQNGQLKLNPLQLEFMEKTYNAALEANANSQTIRFALKGSDIDLPALATVFGTQAPIDAHGNIDIDVNGKGLTPDAITKTLGGKILVVFGPGAFNFNGNDEKAVALMRILFPQGAVQGKPKLNCAAMRFNAVNGMLQTNGLVFDTNFATAAGEGSVDLANHNVNMVLRHISKNSKTASLVDHVPLRISGPLNNLSYMPEEKALVQKAAMLLGGAAGAQSTGVPKVEENGKDNPCLAAVLNPVMITQEPPKTKDIIKDTVKDVTDRYKSIRDGATDPAAAIKGLFGR